MKSLCHFLCQLAAKVISRCSLWAWERRTNYGKALRRAQGIRVRLNGKRDALPMISCASKRSLVTKELHHVKVKLLSWVADFGIYQQTSNLIDRTAGPDDKKS